MLSLMGLGYIQWTEPASKSKKGAERLKAAKPSSPQKIKTVIIIQRKLQLGCKRHSGRHSLPDIAGPQVLKTVFLV